MPLYPAVLSILSATPLLTPALLGLGDPSAVPGAAPAPDPASLLSTVPEDAYALVHCRDVEALRSRAKLNDWFRLLGSEEGDAILGDLAREVDSTTRSDLDELLDMARAIEGEVVFFDTGAVAGFVTEPPSQPASLIEMMRDWLPAPVDGERSTMELAGGTAELVAWPAEDDGWSGRAGHFAALVVHPSMLALYSGDDSAAVVAAMTDSVAGLGAARRAPIVSSFTAEGGGGTGGIELFVDFTPWIDRFEEELKDAAADVLPDPTDLLGLEAGTWLYASANVFQGTRVECYASLHIPAETLASKLADTFRSLPLTLPADLPRGAWAVWATHWDVVEFYRLVREAVEAAGRADGLEMVDDAMNASRAIADVDPIDDVLEQLTGTFVSLLVTPTVAPEDEGLDRLDEIRNFAFHAGLIDGAAFQSAIDKLFDAGGLESFFDLEEVADVDAYVAESDGEFDAGLAFLPTAFACAFHLDVMERSLRALTRVPGASLLDGSSMQAAIEENAGACALSCVELQPARAYLMPELAADFRLAPLEPGAPARDPFDSQLISTARRTTGGFEFRVTTR